MYELALTMEILITLVFWTILYPGETDCNANNPNGIHELHCVNLLGDHCVPLFCLLVDYTFNVQPIVKRHIWVITVTVIAYLIVNIFATFYRGEPVYPPMDWQTPEGIIMPLSCILATFVGFYTVVFLNNKKLKS